ncbi:3-deoxy-manno-octulosonate-8-phosphatase KdsC [Thermochromatium tepidum]|jgi:HAD-superfamily hydrolase, subfamily IIIA|uniref:3-deoxy-D-manno-octulosonate 8-phosphate phosphatase KdsC n=1 Tax=Thermochromatium tepidum ATCC 43061 TaxID=316276 RepID=A0A6I6E0A4_THETI|nr:3-deoxy-manno-octulosonate-8-phosphatase KdsC [Thermochromatium tepidum]QGU33401.1 3-deoxy-manno-octulosonate-8-phosphatase KdsC [Thermochromatium tepidum ATCC 43061]
MTELRERASRIRLVIFDVDGVLTDGSLYLGDDGQEYKAFNARDGHGMVLLQESGVHLAVITGRTSNVVRMRMESLGVSDIFQGYRHKLPAYEQIKQRHGLSDDQIAYVGDDVIDLPVMRRVGLAIAVADADPRVRELAHWRTTAPGGRGAAREVCELILDAQGRLAPLLASYA